LECYDQQRILGPLDHDYGGRRFIPEREETAGVTFSPSVASSATHCDGPRASISPSLDAGHFNAWSPTISNQPYSSAKRKSMSGSSQDESTSASPQQRSLKRLKSDTERSYSPATTVDPSASPRQSSSPYLSPPTPPRRIVKNQWFGNEYTEEDHEYMKNYLGYACRRDADPDFKKIFREMGKNAPQHTGPQWEKYFFQHEVEFVSDIPVLKRLYVSSGEEREEEGDGPTQSARQRSKSVTSSHQRRPLVKPRDKHKLVDAPTVIPSKEDRRALIKFMADAPEAGVTEAELLQNFAHIHPKYSWRTWQKLLRGNKASFERAVAVTRAKALSTQASSASS